MEKTERQAQFNELSRLVTASAAAQESQGLQHTTALLDMSSNIARQMQQHLPGFQMHRHAVDSSITGLKTPVEDVAMRWHQSTDQVHILAWETLNNIPTVHSHLYYTLKKYAFYNKISILHIISSFL